MHISTHNICGYQYKTKPLKIPAQIEEDPLDLAHIWGATGNW